MNFLLSPVSATYNIKIVKMHFHMVKQTNEKLFHWNELEPAISFHMEIFFYFDFSHSEFLGIKMQLPMQPYNIPFYISVK